MTLGPWPVHIRPHRGKRPSRHAIIGVSHTVRWRDLIGKFFWFSSPLNPVMAQAPGCRRLTQHWNAQSLWENRALACINQTYLSASNFGKSGQSAEDGLIRLRPGARGVVLLASRSVQFSDRLHPAGTTQQAARSQPLPPRIPTVGACHGHEPFVPVPLGRSGKSP